MAKQLDKVYDPKHVEERLYQFWQDNGYFRAEVYIDGLYHASLVTGASGAYAESTVSIPPLAGRHTLQLEFYGEFTEAKLDEFVFTRR